MRAVLKKPALISILCATVETFKKECLFVLLGYKKNDIFVIENAIPLQTAHREFSETKISKRRFDLVLGVSKCLWKTMQIIGDCHSHPEFSKHRYPATPSKADEKRSEKNNVYIIVGISTKRKTQTWKKTVKKTLIGTIEKYNFEINAYWSPEDKKVEQIPLICPSAYRLNAFKK